jgi:hypothetical protein
VLARLDGTLDPLGYFEDMLPAEKAEADAFCCDLMEARRFLVAAGSEVGSLPPGWVKFTATATGVTS